MNFENVHKYCFSIYLYIKCITYLYIVFQFKDLGPDVQTICTHKQHAHAFYCAQIGIQKDRMCDENVCTTYIVQTMYTNVYSRDNKRDVTLE